MGTRTSSSITSDQPLTAPRHPHFYNQSLSGWQSHPLSLPSTTHRKYQCVQVQNLSNAFWGTLSPQHSRWFRWSEQSVLMRALHLDPICFDWLLSDMWWMVEEYLTTHMAVLWGRYVPNPKLHNHDDIVVDPFYGCYGFGIRHDYSYPIATAGQMINMLAMRMEGRPNTTNNVWSVLINYDTFCVRTPEWDSFYDWMMVPCHANYKRWKYKLGAAREMLLFLSRDEPQTSIKTEDACCHCIAVRPTVNVNDFMNASESIEVDKNSESKFVDLEFVARMARVTQIVHSLSNAATRNQPSQNLFRIQTVKHVPTIHCVFRIADMDDFRSRVAMFLYATHDLI
jgi:hypothetical protein